MSKIVVTIEDKPGDLVEVIFTPTCETLIQKNASGNGMTSAEGYALSVANHLRRVSKEQGSLRVLIPRIGRA